MRMQLSLEQSLEEPEKEQSTKPMTKKAKDLPHSAHRDALHQFYDQIQHQGILIAPEQDIKIGKPHNIPLNINSTEKIQLTKESYNSTLLFTLLTTVLGDGTMMYFGPPGAGKTTAPEIIGSALYDLPIDEIHKATIFGHPEQTQEKMVARFSLADLLTGEEIVSVRDFMKSPIRILDEVNRLPPGKLSILYQLVDRGFTDYGDEVVHATKGPLFMTANASDEGNFPIPPPFLDRVDVAVISSYLNPLYLPMLTSRKPGKQLDIKLTSGDLDIVRDEISNVSFEGDELYRFIHFLSESNYCFNAGTTLERKTKAHAQFKKPGNGLCTSCHYFPGKSKSATICYLTQEGISPRSYQSIARYAKAFAWWRQKEKVSHEDLEAVLPFALWHKLTPTKKAYENNPLFINDRVSFVSDLFDQSRRSYLSTKKIYDNYDSILETVARALTRKDTAGKAQLQESILGHLRQLQDLDSPAKYPLAVTLSQAYDLVR